MALDTFVFGLKFPEEVLRDYAVPNVFLMVLRRFNPVRNFAGRSSCCARTRRKPGLYWACPSRR
jgi:hypothetical protein